MFNEFSYHVLKELWVGDFPTLVDCMLSNGNWGRTWLSEEIFFFLTIRGMELARYGYAGHVGVLVIMDN